LPRRVVVTGIGFVSPVGNDTGSTWDALVAGKSGAARIQRWDPSAFGVQIACEVKDYDPLQYMDRKEVKRADRYSHYAMGATVQALADAGMTDGIPDPDHTGVVIGSGIGGIETFEEQCKLYLSKGPNRVSPFFVPMFIPDIASGLVSIRTGARGPNYATVSACASSAHAIGEAFRLIQHGKAEMMITGGAEAAITPLAIAGFSNMKALSPRNDEPEKASRPFDKGRDGFVMGDGAAVVVLESLESAQSRGARILGEVIGYGMSADAYHMTSPSPDGDGAKRAMRDCLSDAQIAPGEVAYINAHGTSTPLGDTAEVKAVKAVFGDAAHDVIMGSSKSMTGHLLGAAGGLEFGICVKVLETGIIPPTINQDTSDPECDLNCAPNTKVERSVSVAMSNSFGFGGHNVSLAVRRYDG